MAKKRVLIIDDEPDFVKLLQARLQIEGYEVSTAEDGIKGIQAARRDRPDVIILDIMMPGMDGHTVCDMLKKSTLTWAIPVIYLTAKTGEADELRALEKGAKYYLTKPYNPEMFMEMVRSAISETEGPDKISGRILIIDRDLSFVNDLEAKLRQAGYEVAFSPSADQGLQMARQAPPDIILMDFTTSHANGHAGIKSIGREPSLQNTAIFILAPQSVIDRVDQRTSTLEKFLPKPINYGLLLDTLQRTLRLKKG